MKEKIINWLPTWVVKELKKQKINFTFLEKKVDILYTSITFSGDGKRIVFETDKSIKVIIEICADTKRIMEIWHKNNQKYEGDYHKWLVDVAPKEDCYSCSNFGDEPCNKQIKKGKVPTCGKYYRYEIEFPKNRKLIGMINPKFKVKEWKKVANLLYEKGKRA